jgi:hypothetical protein
VRWQGLVSALNESKKSRQFPMTAQEGLAAEEEEESKHILPNLLVIGFEAKLMRDPKFLYF